jgi:hypothetical protein
MKRILIVLLLLCAPVSAQRALVGPGISYVPVGSIVAIPGVFYTGPGDIVPGSEDWYGLRAYSGATRGTHLINVCNVGDATCADLSSDSKSGSLIVTTIGGQNCANVTCTIKTWYDQGTGAKNITQVTIASRPTLNIGAFNCNGFSVCANYAGVPGNISSGAIATPQPFTTSLVAVRTGPATFTSIFGTDNGSTTFIYTTYGAAAGSAEFAATNSLIEVCCSEQSWHSLQGLANSTASTITGDFQTLAGNLGADTIQATDNIHLGSDGFGEACTCQIVEAGIWPLGLSPAQNTALTQNQHAYYNFINFFGDGASSSISPVFGYGGTNVASTNTEWLFWEGWEPVGGTLQRVVEGTTFMPATNMWSQNVIVGTNTLTNDPHGQPSVAADPVSGCVYVFYGAHVGNVQISQTTTCGNPTTWTASSLSAATYGNFTFTKPFIFNGTLYLFYETGGVGTGIEESIAVTTAAINPGTGALTWSLTNKHIIDVATAGNDGWILGGTFFQSASGSQVSFTFSFGSSVGVFPIQNIYYGIYDIPTGNVLNINATSTIVPASQPVSKAILDASYRVVASPDVEVGVITTDFSGLVHIAYGDAASGTAKLQYVNSGGSPWTTPITLFTYVGLDTASDIELPGITTNAAKGVDVYYSDATFLASNSFSAGSGNIWKLTRPSGGSFGPASEILATIKFGLNGLTAVQNAPGQMMMNEVSNDGLTISGVLKGFVYNNTAFINR